MDAIATGYFEVVIPLFNGTEATGALKSNWVFLGRMLSPTLVVKTFGAGDTFTLEVLNFSAENFNPPQYLFTGTGHDPNPSYSNGSAYPVTDNVTSTNDVTGVPHPSFNAITAPTAASLGGAYTFVRGVKNNSSNTKDNQGKYYMTAILNSQQAK